MKQRQHQDWIPTLRLGSLLLMLSLVLVSQAQLAGSTFDTDTEGWTVYNDARDLQWVSNVGNPPGSLFARDIGTGAWWGFESPDEFLGDKSAAYGETLSWEVNPSARDTNDNSIPDATLIGGGLTLVINLPMPTINTWNRYSVLLTESGGWRKGSFTGAVPTRDEMLTVLSNLTALRLRGEFRTGSDQAYLDNVFISGHPSVPGDVNGDGCVDDADLASVIFEFGGQESGAFGNTDLNDDGIVDDADLAEVIFNFGNGC